MKNLGTNYCLQLQIEHKTNQLLIHQSTHVEKILKYSTMHNAYSYGYLISRSKKKDSFRFKKDDEEINTIVLYHI